MRMQPQHYWKNDLKNIQALNGIRTHDLCVTGAINPLPTELSKPHESGRVWVRPFMFSGHNTWFKYMNFVVIGVQQ